MGKERDGLVKQTKSWCVEGLGSQTRGSGGRIVLPDHQLASNCHIKAAPTTGDTCESRGAERASRWGKLVTGFPRFPSACL